MLVREEQGREVVLHHLVAVLRLLDKRKELREGIVVDEVGLHHFQFVFDVLT